MRYLLEKLDRIETGQLKQQRALDAILRALTKETMSSAALLAEVTELQAELANNTNAVNAAKAQLNGFAAKLEAAVANATDDTAAVAAIKDVVATFKANDDALAQAVVANTPAAPASPSPLPAIVAPTTSQAADAGAPPTA